MARGQTAAGRLGLDQWLRRAPCQCQASPGRALSPLSQETFESQRAEIKSLLLVKVRPHQPR